ncbi:MAG TPA: hypothetical protein VGT24_11815 [Candidatus Acidoferrales bacterium]|nr:hypothetical protein [Candidatus Acidoferrales bacterium]
MRARLRRMKRKRDSSLRSE